MRYQQANALFGQGFKVLTKEECPPDIYSWLADETSMTARLASHCQQLLVDVIDEGYVLPDFLSAEERTALSHISDKRYWYREVQLIADGIPWLAGRTIVPEHCLEGQAFAIKKLGNQPLGKYLFNAHSLCRDYLIAGTLGDLWSRRSLLHLAETSLLLTEIFLPASPLYSPLAKGTPRCKL